MLSRFLADFLTNLKRYLARQICLAIRSLCVVQVRNVLTRFFYKQLSFSYVYIDYRYTIKNSLSLTSRIKVSPCKILLNQCSVLAVKTYVL